MRFTLAHTDPDFAARARRLVVLTLTFLIAVLVALIGAAPAVAGTYDSAVLADSPTMYWRLGEADGAITAADASGHGFAISYQSGAVLDLEAGIQNETDTSVLSDGVVAAANPSSASSPGVFEAGCGSIRRTRRPWSSIFKIVPRRRSM